MSEQFFRSKPFPHWIIDNFFEPIPDELLPKAGWEYYEVCYDNDVEKNKYTTRRIDKLAKQFQAVFSELRGAEMVQSWSEIANLKLQDDPILHGGGLHVMGGEGSFLGGHVDYSLHPFYPNMERKMNLIAFLHPEWLPEWGGQLLLMDACGNTVAEVDPLPGRLVAFETSDISYHGVRVLKSGAKRRVSAAVYYLAEADRELTRRRALFFPNRGGDVPNEVR